MTRTISIKRNRCDMDPDMDPWITATNGPWINTATTTNWVTGVDWATIKPAYTAFANAAASNATIAIRDWAKAVQFAWPPDDSIAATVEELDHDLHVDGPRVVHLPDGSRIVVDEHGNWRIEDQDRQVTYRANTSRAFNPFVNAGDQLARFIEYVATIPGVRRGDVPRLPLELFVHWLIIEAALRDEDPLPEDVTPVPQSRLLHAAVRPRCALPTCRRFIRRTVADRGFLYCNVAHAERHERLIAA